MRAFKIIIAVAIAIPVLFFGIGAFLPNNAHVERSAIIEADAATTFYLVSEHKQFQRWSPWAALDPQMRVEYSGPAVGVGSKMEWSGNKDVGQGSSVFIEYEPNTRAVTQLDFGMGGEATATYFLESIEPEKTKVTWTLDTKNDFIFSKYFSLFLDSIVGPLYEQGLEKLNGIAIKQEPIVTETVRYWVSDKEYFGYQVYPIGLLDPVPGVLIIPSIWGQGEHERKRARMLAQEGYFVFVADLYGQAYTTEDMEDAIKQMEFVDDNKQLQQALIDTALDQMHIHRVSDEVRTSVIGYSVGGVIAINLAREGKNFISAASFYSGFGGLSPISENAFTPSIIFNGQQDQFSDSAQRIPFEKAMDEAGLKYTIVDFPDAGHGFANPLSDNLGTKAGFDFIRYNKEADEASWQLLLQFLHEKNFGNAIH